MNPANRRQTLADLLADKGQATVVELAHRLGVSDDTIRRDLEVLAEKGILQKVHGGAVSLDVPAMGRAGRQRLLASVKGAMGRAAAEVVQSGMTVMFDAGNSVLAVAQALPDVDLTVVTHSLDIASLLSARPRVKLVLAGGLWNPRQRLFEGPHAQALVASCRADLAFLGACSVDFDRGVSATDLGDAEVKRAMVSASIRKVLVADHTKLATVQPWFVAPLSSFDLFITDRPVAWSGPGPAVCIPESLGGSPWTPF